MVSAAEAAQERNLHESVQEVWNDACCRIQSGRTHAVAMHNAAAACEQSYNQGQRQRCGCRAKRS